MGTVGQIAAAGIDQATQLTTAGLNMWNTWRTNEQAYDQSRKLWNLNNEYNKPINQMKRLEEAGLNPFLVYGNGATGNTSAQPSSPAVQRPNFNINAAQSMLLGMNLEKMQKEIDLTEKKNDLLETQLGNLQFNSKMFKKLGLPTNAAWWSPMVLQFIKDPEKINFLKNLGFNLSDWIWGKSNSPGYFYPTEQEQKEWTPDDWLNNGKVVIEHVDKL